MSAPSAASPPLPLRNCYWVVPGLLLAGEHPGGSTRDKTKDRLKKLLAAGIECFVDLTKPTELLRYDVHLPFYVEYSRKSIKDHGVPGSRAQMAEILDCIRNALGAGRPVYVHCRAGIGRTGMVVGCLLVERGLSGDAAIDELNRLWQQCKRSKSWSFVPETESQANYIREWTPNSSEEGSEVGVASVPPPAIEPMYVSEPTQAAIETVAVTQARAASRAFAASEARTGSAKLGAGQARDTATHDPAAGEGRAATTAAAAARARAASQGATAGQPHAVPQSDIADQPRAADQAPFKAPGRSPTPVSATSRVSASAHATSAPVVEPDPLLEPTTLSAARGLRERFLGALFGLAVGDAVAAATQYRRPGTFTPVGDMLGGGPFDLPRGAWSDDTAMALCLAESLLECNGFDARDQVLRYGRWQQEGYLSSTGQCVGITASTARALAISKWRRHVFPGSHDPEQLDPEPLSRVAPATLFFFASLETSLQQAADSARTTCQAPAVLDCCRRLSRALHAGLSGQPKGKILADIPSIGQTAGHSNTTAATALAAAFWAFSSTDNFRDAVLLAANLGGNSDVVAAVCGQLAGAHYGVSAIPSSWRNGLIQKDLIESYADRLLAHGLISLGN